MGDFMMPNEPKTDGPILIFVISHWLMIVTILHDP